MLLLILPSITAGCDIEPFGLTTRTIISPYSLEIWEDGETYYLQGPPNIGWGALEGTIGKIGWKEQYILTWQNDNGQGKGWRVIDTVSKRLSPILSDNELKLMQHLQNISPVPPKNAWDKI